MIPEIRIEDYTYDLPDERIAKYPLAERDSSSLLKYDNGQITKQAFKDLPSLLPENHMIVFNDTKVVPARLHFQRSTGAHIEIFCLEPVLPEEYVSMFAVTDRCRWKCIVGNVKRWKQDTLHLYNPENDAVIEEMGLKADLIQRDGETSIVEFSWADGAPFSRVLEICGSIPIPPSLVALPPIPIIKSRQPFEMASFINSPNPKVVVCIGFFSSPETSVMPEASAISITAVSPIMP